MESTRARSGSRETSRRTNSLAFAKNDCHTCRTLKKRCDRQRPRCGTCLSQGVKCDGFAMPLVWKGPEINASISSNSGSPGSSHNQNHDLRRNAEFKFVQGRPKRKRKPRANVCYKDAQSQGCFSVTSPSFVENASEPSPASAALAHSESPSTPILEHTGGDENPAETAIVDVWNVQSVATNVSLDDWSAPGFLPAMDWDDSEPSAALSSELPLFANVEAVERYSLGHVVLSPTVLYQDLAHKYSNILEMYNKDFCVMPLTHDCNANPFRVRLDRIQESPSLLHAVMALSSQHLAKINISAAMAAEMHTHQSTAIQLFSEALNSPDSEPVLDTLLLLIIFEISQSAHGMWSVHLNGARSLLEQIDAGEKIKTNIRMRGQVGMLVWWDVTIALISRREPILPITYLETLVEFPESKTWSFIVLAGCPIQFLMAMARLAKLASIYEKITKMEWTLFNDLPVQLVVEDVQRFNNAETVNFVDMDSLGDDPNARRNRFCCIEAWRYAILLFAARAFCQRQDTYGMRKITHLARMVLDCVRCIPQTEFFQKQLLLPVFLAGSETGSEIDRMFVRQYFQHWNETSRFEHFGSARELLEDVWKDWDVSTRDVYWWGTKIHHQSVGRTNPMVSEALLG